MKETRRIRNRDIPLLERVLYVMQEVCSIEKRCLWQRDRMYNITQHITGMPGGGGLPSGLDAAFAALDGSNQEYRKKIASYMHELKTAEKIINGIASQTMRTFVVLMYVDGLPPDKVRAELNMSEWGFRRARSSIEQAQDMKSVVWREKYIVEEN